MPTRIAATILLLTCAWIPGCSSGEKPIKTASITGEVKRMSGEPVGKVKVVFYPNAGPTAVAVADDGGKFTANVALGECRVAVVVARDATPDMSPDATAKAAEADSKLDSRFASPDSSGLKAKVEEKQTEKVVFIVD
jgi:hypothetical protein